MHSTLDGNTAALNAHQRLLERATESARLAGPAIEARADDIANSRDTAHAEAALDLAFDEPANRDELSDALIDVLTAYYAGRLDYTARAIQDQARSAALASVLEVADRIKARADRRAAEQDVLGTVLSPADVTSAKVEPAEVY